MQANKNKLLSALEKSLGVVSTACKNASISRDTHYRWIREDAGYKLAVESIDDIVLDFAESQLHKQIKQGNTAATIFYLKTKGRRRGYVETMNIDQTNRNAVADMTDEELNAEIDRLERIRKAISD